MYDVLMKTQIILSALFIASLIGCSSAPTEPAAKDKTPEAKPAAETAAVVDFKNDKGELVCPVMNTVIAKKEEAQGFQDFEGKRYYFCCGKCPSAFKSDPAKYAKK
jgi:YHS domain-containing protein